MVRNLKARLAELEDPDVLSAALSPETLKVRGPHADAASLAAQEGQHSSTLARTAASTKENLSAPLLSHLDEASSAENADCVELPSTEGELPPATLGPWTRSLDSRVDNVMSPNLASRITLSTACTCIDGLKSLDYDLPIRWQSDALVDAFFGRHNRMMPILHQPTFMHRYRWLWTSGSINEPPQCMRFCKRPLGLQIFLATANAVFAFGALFGEGPSKQNLSKAERYFSQVWKGDLLATLNDDSTLDTIQLGLLMSLYLQSTEKYSRCWNILGLTIRLAQNRGLQYPIEEARHRSLVKHDISQLDLEVRARLWCVCLILDTEISLSFDQPCMITAHIEDALLPSAIDDVFVNMTVGIPPTTQPAGSPSLLHYFVETVKLYQILKEVHRLCGERTQQPAPVSARIQVVMELYKRAIEWMEQVPPSYKHGWNDVDVPNNNSSAQRTQEQRAGSSEPLKSSDLSRRLYYRFMHTAQLILRPSLEMLYEVQHGAHREFGSASFHEAVLGPLAIRCVQFAVQLSDVLTREAESRRLSCWWYNIAYLHTCGSTFSIAQLCTFTNPGPNSNATKINVVRSFNNCLDHLSRYVDFSAVARKCSKLLQESVKRQTTKNLQQNRPHPPLPSTGSATPTAAVQTNRDERREADIRTSIAPLAFNTTIPGTSQPVISEADFSFITPNSLPFGIEASDYCFNPEAFGPANDGYCPNLDLSDSMPWPALPSLSQLESAAFEI